MQRSLRFRYNSAFLPEFFSTILISIPVSALFLTGQQGGCGFLWGSTHSSIALTSYLFVAACLFGLTVFYRIIYRTVVLAADHTGQTYLNLKGSLQDLSEVDRAEVGLGRFFGRTARKLKIHDSRNEPLEVSEALVGFDALQRAIAELKGFNIDPSREYTPEQLDSTTAAWKERHRIFPEPENVTQWIQRLGWRMVCLLPVAVCDVLVNVLIILMFHHLQKQELMVYSAPVGLIASGFIARFVYYYLFTSTILNRPLGQKVRM